VLGPHLRVEEVEALHAGAPNLDHSKGRPDKVRAKPTGPNGTFW
jgi:hypothetical protein